MAKQNASRLGKEIKITVAAITVLLGVFGYLLFQRLHGGPQNDDSPPRLAQLSKNSAAGEAPAGPNDVPPAPSARAMAASDWGIADDRWSQVPADDDVGDDYAATSSSSRRSGHEEPLEGSIEPWDADGLADEVDPTQMADEPAELTFPTPPDNGDPFLARDFDRDTTAGENDHQFADNMPGEADVMPGEADVAFDEDYDYEATQSTPGDFYADEYSSEPLMPADDVAISPQPRDEDFEGDPTRTGNAALANHRDRYDPGRGPTVAPAANTANRDAGNRRYGTPTPADSFDAADDSPDRYSSAAPERYRPAAPARDGDYGYREPAGLPQHHAQGFDRTNDRYLIQTADNYWTISKRLYGTGGYFKALYEHNKRAFPRADQLRPGEEISAPSIAVLEQNYPHLCPRPLQTVREPATTTVSSSGRSRRGGRSYTVREGDTLFDIARHELGKAGRWVEIYDLNRAALGDNVDLLRPGTELTLPAPDPADPITRRYDGPVRR